MLIFFAMIFSRIAHFGQKRKYTGEPYFYHTQEVANIVASVPHTKEQIAAAYLHDTVEDTWVQLWMIRLLFGTKVASLVSGLTDISRPEDGNRAKRKQLDLVHSSFASPDGKTVKLADIISNSISIAENDPKFAKVYMAEKERLLEVLNEGDRTLYAKAREILDNWNSFKKIA